jgi:AMME syndrome candidate gene 1 protein
MSDVIQAVPDHCAYCFKTIIAKLTNIRANDDNNLDKLSVAHADTQVPLFVTWKKTRGDSKTLALRGCIGTFQPGKLQKSLQQYANIAAFKDRRFDPIVKSEVPKLECAVSLLVNFEQGTDFLDWEVSYWCAAYVRMRMCVCMCMRVCMWVCGHMGLSLS